jgi:hypothetical protein
MRQRALRMLIFCVALSCWLGLEYNFNLAESSELWSFRSIETGREFVDRCENNAQERKSCEAFVLGLTTGIFKRQVDLMAIGVPMSSWREPPLCSNEKLTIEIILDVLLIHIRNNIEHSNGPVMYLLESALDEQWPCPGSRRRNAGIR